jgi:hypothetical protein
MAATASANPALLPRHAAGRQEWAALFSLTVLALLLIGIGVYPDTLIRLIQTFALS